MMLSDPFQITRHKSPIWEVKVKNEINTGIQVGGPSILGLVPEYRVICAARAAGYRYYHEWQELSWRERALLVAHYLADIMITNHVEDAKTKALNKKNRGKKK